MSSNVTLEEITGHNFEAFMEMELPDHQRDFIASNAFSIAQAKFYADYIPRGIYCDGEPAGFIVLLPNVNEAIADLKGKLLPFGWAKFLWYRRKIDRVRVFALGVKPKYRTTGLAAKLYIEHLDAAERTGVVGGTMGWILENNKPMNKSVEALGGTVIKRFRLYERAL